MPRLQPGLIGGVAAALATARIALAIALAPALAACGGAQPVASPAPRASAELAVIATSSGARLSLGELAAALDGVRVVYVGERHDQRADHDAQRAVIAALLARDPSLGIGMEMFQRPYQAPLDAWVAGTIDEAELLRATEWEARWSLDFALYRPILGLARDHRLPVRALNARTELTRAIAREGMDALAPELRAELPEIDADDGAHRAMVMDALSEHPGLEPARRERFYSAQLVWDETMAASVAAALAAPGAPARLVVLAGRMHVQAGLGIPRRAARRGAEPFRVLLPLEEDELEGAADLCDYALLVRR